MEELQKFKFPYLKSLLVQNNNFRNYWWYHRFSFLEINNYNVLIL